MGFREVLDALATNIYFLFAHNDEKTAVTPSHSLVVRTRLTPPFVDCTSYTSENGVAGLVCLAERNARHPDHVPFYDSVSRCAIAAVWHLRSEEFRHEIVVVKYTLSLQPGSEDTRFARFERFRLPNEDPRRRRKAPPSSEELSRLLETTAHLDSARISDSWAVLVDDHYTVVQMLSAIPAGTFDVLDVVALAHALGKAAHEYSVLRHICQWYAAALFKLLRARAPATAGTYERGPAYHRAGTVLFGRAVVRLVDVDSAALVWPVGEPTADEVATVAYDIFYRCGLPKDALHRKLRRAIEHDAELLRTRSLAFTTIQTTADYLVPQLRHNIKHDADATELTIELAGRTQAAEASVSRERDARLRAEAALAEAKATIEEMRRSQETAGALPPASLPQALRGGLSAPDSEIH